METSKHYGERRVEKCPECKSANLIHDYDTSETACGKCGYVIHEQMMDKGPEWREFTPEERKRRRRVGAHGSYSVHDKGLSTTFRPWDPDAFGRNLQSKRPELHRLYRWQKRTRVYTSIDRNLAKAMHEIDRLSDKVHIPASLKEKAAVIYRKALDKNLMRGRSIAAISAAAIYAACRTTETPRTLREIAEASLVEQKDVARCYRFLLKELKIKMPVANPITYVSKIAERAGISGKTQGVAVRIIIEAKKRRHSSGKDPIGFSAAALYIACLQTNEKKTQKDLAEIAGVTEVTIRNRYKSLVKKLGIEISNGDS